jgi:hypothetical protein
MPYDPSVRRQIAAFKGGETGSVTAVGLYVPYLGTGAKVLPKIFRHSSMLSCLSFDLYAA